MAAAIALEATSMSDIAVLAYLARVRVPRRADRRCAGPGYTAMLEWIARARTKARAPWAVIDGTAAGFPWLVIVGKTLMGWVVIDMDGPVGDRHDR
jgi:hypothetical protein